MSEPHAPSSSGSDDAERNDGLARLPPDRECLALLRTAEIGDCQLVPYGSNYTFAVSLEPKDGKPRVGIYKPRDGEVPLWDFEAGTLYRREYASYLLSRILGWHFIPPTVIRGGPHGIGSVQLYIEPLQGRSGRLRWAEHEDALRRMFLFDVLTNNADRKGSHFFIGRDDGRLWGIDHGLTFNVQPKLRTVIWDFAGEPIPDELREPLRRLARHETVVEHLLKPYISRSEIRALFLRLADLLLRPTFPMLSQRRNIPYGW